MRKLRTILLHCSQEDAQYRLRCQRFPSVWEQTVQDGHFKIYKRLTGFFSGRGIIKPTFCFYGAYLQEKKQTKVAYRIRPGFSILLPYSMLLLLALYQLFLVIFQNESITTLLFILVFLLVYFLIIQFNKVNCIADFEKQLTKDHGYQK
jgi:hypothetical protein